MNIVVEGPDNSGKTTLINYLAPRLRRQIVMGQGPCDDTEDFRRRFFDGCGRHNVIFDRHPCVSEPIYGPICRKINYADMRIVDRFHSMGHLFIYCRNTRGLAAHRADHAKDSPGHLRALEHNHRAICVNYDRWAIEHANLIYRIGDDKDLVLRMLSPVMERV